MPKRPPQKAGPPKDALQQDPAELTPGLRRYLFVTAALCGVAVLIIEILGAKMLAPYFGTSHFVWTAQIAVTLAALATGYAFGGWLADRSSELRHLYTALLLAGLWLCGAALVCEPVAFACLSFRLALGSLLASLILFFVPLALLAMVGPLCIRRLTRSLATVGQSVGALSAISTLGSVAGALLIAYVLIPFLANSSILYLTAGCLVVLGTAYFLIWNPRRKARAVAAVSGAILLLFIGARQPPFASLPHVKELFRANSNFGFVQVVESAGAKPLRYLMTDLMVQNIYDPVNHTGAAPFTFIEDALMHAYSPGEIRDVLCIGMGAGVTPMRIAQAGVGVDVVEINPIIVSAAAQFFDFHRDRVHLEIGDGRYFLHESAKRYDAIIFDAFLGESPPSHLMTQEAFRSVQSRLRPNGLLIVNSWGELAEGKDYVPASLHKTLTSVFQNVHLHVSPGAAFFVASSQPGLRILRQPDLSNVPSDLRAPTQEALQTTRAPDPSHGEILRDDYNPVDYRDATYREELRRRILQSTLSGF